MIALGFLLSDFDHFLDHMDLVQPTLITTGKMNAFVTRCFKCGTDDLLSHIINFLTADDHDAIRIEHCLPRHSFVHDLNVFTKDSS